MVGEVSIVILIVVRKPQHMTVEKQILRTKNIQSTKNGFYRDLESFKKKKTLVVKIKDNNIF